MTHGHGHALPAGFDIPVGPPGPRHLRRFLAFMEDEHGARGRHGRRGHRGGGPGDMNFMFRFGPPGGRGPRARRGDVRAAALLLLAEEPRNGYAIMQAIQERTGGVWRPSPGAVYPALQQLEDEALVRQQDEDGRRVYHLTDAGRTYVEERRGELVAPWDAVNQQVGEGGFAVFNVVRDLHVAAMQLAHVGNEQQVEQATRILTDARRALYRTLADDEDPGESPAAE
jgi:DNA-binding PadR family transcriptional regulator